MGWGCSIDPLGLGDREPVLAQVTQLIAVAFEQDVHDVRDLARVVTAFASREYEFDEAHRFVGVGREQGVGGLQGATGGWLDGYRIHRHGVLECSPRAEAAPTG